MSEKNPYKKGGMFESVSFLLFENAKQLRNKMTFAEEVLWRHLKKGISGYKFRRQQVSKQIETVLNTITEIVNNIIKTKLRKSESKSLRLRRIGGLLYG